EPGILRVLREARMSRIDTRSQGKLVLMRRRPPVQDELQPRSVALLVDGRAVVGGLYPIDLAGDGIDRSVVVVHIARDTLVLVLAVVRVAAEEQLVGQEPA